MQECEYNLKLIWWFGDFTLYFTFSILVDVINLCMKLDYKN